MKRINHSLTQLAFFLLGLTAFLTACNKDLPEATPIATPAIAPIPSVASLVANDPDLTIFKAALARAGSSLTATLADSTGVYTVFAPTDAAFQAVGINAAVINMLSPGRVDTLLRYHIIGGQSYHPATEIAGFPNVQAPSLFVLAPPSATLPPGLRMPLFLSRRGDNMFINNIPIISSNINASNGTVYKVPFPLLPPTRFLWNRIDTDPDLTYLKAAIQRADSGAVAASSLQAALQNPAASLTVFAPTNAAFMQVLTGQITMALMARGMDQATAGATAAALASTPDVFANPALYTTLTPTLVKGLVVYHLLGKRAFSVNLPTTPTQVPTLLNTAVANHPGVSVQATFGATGVTAATVKGAANAAASNVLINPTPEPGGTSDQHYINGVLHKIDQVLLPQ